MSKSKQRQISAYQDGWHDRKAGRPYRWLRHPNLADYRRDWMAAASSGEAVPDDKPAACLRAGASVGKTVAASIFLAAAVDYGVRSLYPPVIIVAQDEVADVSQPLE